MFNPDVGITLDEYIKENDKLIWSVVSKFKYLKVDNDDLFQEAATELIRCYHAFDKNKGTKFSTFAYTCMCGRLRNYHRTKYKLIKPSRKALDVWGDIHKNELENASTKEISETLGYDEVEVSKALKFFDDRNFRNIDATSEDSDSYLKLSLNEMIGSEDDVSIVEAKMIFENALNELELKLVQMKLEDYTQPEMAKWYGCTQTYISKVFRGIRKKLKMEMQEV